MLLLAPSIAAVDPSITAVDRPPRPSAGCGTKEPFKPSDSPQRFSFSAKDDTQPEGDAERWYWLNLPKVYEKRTPAALVLSFHGFYDQARDEIYEDSLPTWIDRHEKNVVTAYPVGSSDVDNDHAAYERFGWNIDGNGLNKESGPMGPVCDHERMPADEYTCYKSCRKSAAGCNEKHGCNCASCMQDSRFVRQLLDRLESELCIDLDRIHLTGISNGALMVYQLALDLAGRVASVAPVAGSRFLGYNHQPVAPVALLDIHGYADIYVPANASARTVTKTTNVTKPLKHRTVVTTTTITTEVLAGPAGSIVSEDDFYYTPLANLTAAFAAANGCAGGNLPHPTRWDGVRDFSCNRPHGECGASAVVQCAGDWGHTWPLHEVYPLAYAELVLDFFKRHPLRNRGDGAGGDAEGLHDAVEVA